MPLIKLEIAIDYPIQWEFCRVFRDLIQNFYDSLSPEVFEKNFKYEFELQEDGYHVTMENRETEFSYEWLTYVGGSTKTDKSAEYIGKYGEGFKMAALRIMQMGGMRLIMHSKNWEISPITYYETIDDRTIPMLGYDYREVPNDGITRLEIWGVNESYKYVLEEALLEFCYPENKLFGHLVGNGKEWELYERSQKTIPCRQHHSDLKGILYINNLARGRLDFPVIINYKTSLRYDSRSRETLCNAETVKLLHEVSQKFDARTSLFLLEILKKKWNECPKDIYDINTKYYLICQLVRNVVTDEKVMSEFKCKYKDLVYMDRKNGDSIHNKLIDETKAWSRDNNTKQIVNPVFRLLDATSLVSEYQNIRNSLYKQPSKEESCRANILYTVVNKIIPLKLTDKMPEILISEDEKVVCNPLQFAEKNHVKIKGYKKKNYEIYKLVFRHEDFQEGAYFKTLIKMAEVLLHTYGADRSKTLTVLLTHLGQWMLDGAEVIKEYEIKWNKANEENRSVF